MNMIYTVFYGWIPWYPYYVVSMFLSVFIYLTAAETCLPVLMFVIQPNWHINQLTYGPKSAPTNTSVLVAWLFYLTYKQVLDAWLLQHSLWLIDPTRLHVWAPTGQPSSQLQPKLCSRWSDIVLRQTPPICEQIVLYLKTAIFNFLTGQHPTRFIWCFYFVPELNPNTKVKFNTIHSLLAALDST